MAGTRRLNGRGHSSDRTKSNQARLILGKAIIESLETRKMLTATPLYWNPTGGTGTWDTDPTNTPWHTSSPTGPAVAWDNTADDQAVFPAGTIAGGITLGADITAASLGFSDGALALNGGYSLTLDGGTSQLNAQNLTLTNTDLIIQSELDDANGSITIDTGSTLDVEGTLSVTADASPGASINVIDGGQLNLGSASVLTLTNTALNVDVNSQLNFASTATVVLNAGTVQNIFGSLAIDGGPIAPQATGDNEVDIGNPYTLNLSAAYGDTPLITLSNWSIQWGDGNSDGYSVTDPTQAIAATHVYPTDVYTDTTYTLVITATTTAYNNLPAFTFILPTATVTVDTPVLLQPPPTPPSPYDLTATESSAGEVDLNWQCDTDLATGFVVSYSTADGDLGSVNTDANTFNYDFTDLPADDPVTFSVISVAGFDGFYADSSPAYLTAAAPAENLAASAPPEVTAGDGSQLSLSSESAISNWQVSWTDSNSMPIENDNYSADGSYDLPDTGGSGLIALVTATDPAGYSFTLPAVNVVVDQPAVIAESVPDAPTNLSVTNFSSSEIDLSWIDNSTTATGDIIYESTDGGNTFNQFDEIAPAAPGSINTYAVTGLDSGTSYQFYISADGGYTQPSASNTIAQSTTFVAPTLDVESTGTAVEGQTYELDLTAEYPDGEAGVIDHWAVDWNDGAGNTSDVIDYSYPSGADPTQPLAVTHVFNSGIANANVSVTAVDSVNGSFNGGSQGVAVTPAAPTLSSVSASGAGITVNWTNVSHISTGTTVLLSTDGANYFEAASVGAGVTSTTVSDVNLDGSYSVEVQTNSANGISNVSNSMNVSTGYVAPVLLITPENVPTEGQQYTLSLSATYADDTPQSDIVDHWLVDWGDGSGSHNYSGAVATASNTYSDGTSSAVIQITAVDGTGRDIDYPTQTINLAPVAPTDLSAMYNSDGTSATLTWQGSSGIASGYVVEYLAPGTTTETVVATVPANTDPSDQSYSYTVTSLDESSYAGDDLLTVVTEGPDPATGPAATSTAPAAVSPSPYSDDPDAPPLNPSAGVYDLNVGGAAVPIGGEVDWPVYYNGPSYGDLTASSSNPQVMAVDDPTVHPPEPGDQFGYVVVRGASYGNADIIVKDHSGDVGDSGTYTTSAPQVSSSGTLTEGVTSNTSGFTFSIDVSITDVTINYDTDGSTLPDSMMGQLSGGSVTIPAGQTSVFVPFNVADDGKIAPTRVAVVTVDSPGVPSDQASRAEMNVLNTDKPTIKMNGASDNAVIPLDPQGDKTKLTDISMAASVSQGVTLVSTTLTWFPSQFTIWLDDEVGIEGADLGSAIGVQPNDNGTVSYTWMGKGPTDVYGQDLTGSSDWDATGVTITANVAVAETEKIPLATASPYNTSHGTARGAVLFIDGSPGKPNDMLIGQGVTAEVVWEGPYYVTAPSSPYSWDVPNAVSGYSDGVLVQLDLNTQPDYESAAEWDNHSVHFYWSSFAGNRNSVKNVVTCSGSYYGNSFGVSATCIVWTPAWSFNRNVPAGTPTLIARTLSSVQLLTPTNTPGIQYLGSAADTGLPVSLAGGSWHVTQLVTPNDAIWIPGGGNYSLQKTGFEGLDTREDAGFAVEPGYPFNDAPLDATTHLFTDDPSEDAVSEINGLRLFTSVGDSIHVHEAFRTFMMFVPPGLDVISVPLAVANWRWDYNEISLTNTLTPWSFSGAAPIAVSDPAGKATSEFPQWTYVVTAGNFKKD